MLLVIQYVDNISRHLHVFLHSRKLSLRPDWRQFAASTSPIWNATATFTDYRAHHFASQPIPSCWRLDWRARPGTVQSARSPSRLSCASLQKIRAIKANQVSGTRSAACPRSPLLTGYLPQARAATGHTGEARCKHIHRRASQDHLTLTQGICSLRCPECYEALRVGLMMWSPPVLSRKWDIITGEHPSSGKTHIC